MLDDLHAVTVSKTEEPPAEFPPVPEGLSAAAAALDPGFIWQRIESWVAVRWSPREATWLVTGPGMWAPPLAPATITAAEEWGSDGWAAVELPPSPFGGFCLPGGHFRFTATVGAGPVPEAAQEAFRRLAEYLVARDPGPAGTSSYTLNVGDFNETWRRSPAWVARALEYSGAADLLRPYRRAG